MEYKGYLGHASYDDEAEIFHGDVINVNHVITFQGKSVAQLKKAFRESVDVYLEFCKEEGLEPAKPYSGKFSIRTTPELHQKLSVVAKSEHKSLNAFVCNTLDHAISA
jgi:predicted HicB family RNase H-like nuclease